MFGVVNTQLDAKQNLCTMQMQEHDHFETHTFETSWNHMALQSELYRSLPAHIKDVMRMIACPDDYYQLRDLAMQIDQ